MECRSLLCNVVAFAFPVGLDISYRNSCKSECGMISFLQKHWRLAFSLLLLLIGLGVDYVSSIVIPDTIRLAWYLMAYIPVAVPVLRRALTLMKSGEIFTEFTLMGIATLGALLRSEERRVGKEWRARWGTEYREGG